MSPIRGEIDLHPLTVDEALPLLLLTGQYSPFILSALDDKENIIGMLRFLVGSLLTAAGSLGMLVIILDRVTTGITFFEELYISLGSAISIGIACFIVFLIGIYMLRY